MAKCANCDSTALYIYETSPTQQTLYCDSDLPSFLYSRRNSGSLPTTPEFKQIQQENEAGLAVGADTVPEKSSRKKTVIEEPVLPIVEETPVSEAVAE